jgi:hypothetical protein
MRRTKAIASAAMLTWAVAGAFTGTARAQDHDTPETIRLYAAADTGESSKGKSAGKKTGKKKPEGESGKKTAGKKRGPKQKMRVGAMGQIVTGPKNGPKPGVYGFGGSVGYRLMPTIEAEVGLSYFSYGLNYADFEILVDITDIAFNADGIFLLPVSSGLNLRGRGGVGMHNTSAKVTGTLVDDAGTASESVTSLAINLGGGLEINFGAFYLAGEIRKPVLFSKTEAVGGNLLQLTGEAGMRF